MVKNNKTQEQDYRKSLAKRGILQLEIKDKKMLYACYMPFVRGCGIFYPELSGQQLGDEVFLLLNLPKNNKRFAVGAKVIWQNSSKKLGRRVPGIGLQILGIDADEIHLYIEDLLGSKQVKSPIPTSTM